MHLEDVFILSDWCCIQGTAVYQFMHSMGIEPVAAGTQCRIYIQFQLEMLLITATKKKKTAKLFEFNMEVVHASPL